MLNETFQAKTPTTGAIAALLRAASTYLGAKFAGKKTYITAIATVLGAAGTYLSGDITLYQSIMLAVPSILAATIRHGIKTELAPVAVATGAVVETPAAPTA